MGGSGRCSVKAAGMHEEDEGNGKTRWETGRQNGAVLGKEEWKRTVVK